MPPQTDKYYHYTNRRGADGIKASGVIKQSGASKLFGPGVYFTDLDPNYYFRNEILGNNYGGISNIFKTNSDYVVVIDKTSLNSALLKTHTVMGTSRRIFCYTREIKVTASQVIDKPTCRYCADKLFHYTSTAIAREIRSALKIKQSDIGPFGQGVLLTELNPYANYRDEILKNNYGGSPPGGHENRADWVIVVERNTLQKSNLVQINNIGSRNVWIYKNDITVLAKNVKDKPQCKRK